MLYLIYLLSLELMRVAGVRGQTYPQGFGRPSHSYGPVFFFLIVAGVRDLQVRRLVLPVLRDIVILKRTRNGEPLTSSFSYPNDRLSPRALNSTIDSLTKLSEVHWPREQDPLSHSYT